MRSVLVAVLLGASSSAWAQDAEPVAGEPMRAHLSWARGPGAEACAPEDAIAADVIARLGRDPFDDGAPTRIEGVVLREGESWRARILVRGEDGSPLGERTLESPAASCASLDDASALAIALVIDPEAALRPPPTAPPPPPPPPPVPECPSCPSCAVCEVPRSPLRGRIAAGAIGALGLLPGPAIGVVVAGAIELDRWVELELGLRHFVGSREGEFGRVAGVALTAGQLGVRIPVFDDPLLRVGVGAGVLVGAQGVAVYDLVPVQPGEHPWIAIEASGRVAVAIAYGIGLELWVEGVVPLVRNRLLVEGGPAFVEEPVSAALVLMLTADLR